MYVQKSLPEAGKVSKPGTTDFSADEGLLDETPKSVINNESDGSIGSHLMYGLGALVFALPMLLPGIPMNWLAEFYVGLMLAGIVGYMFWRALSALKTRWRHRRL
jgi:hypothetical protein